MALLLIIAVSCVRSLCGVNADQGRCQLVAAD